MPQTHPCPGQSCIHLQAPLNWHDHRSPGIHADALPQQVGQVIKMSQVQPFDAQESSRSEASHAIAWHSRQRNQSGSQMKSHQPQLPSREKETLLPERRLGRCPRRRSQSSRCRAVSACPCPLCLYLSAASSWAGLMKAQQGCAHLDVSEQHEGLVQRGLQLVVALLVLPGAQLVVHELGHQLRRPARRAGMPSTIPSFEQACRGVFKRQVPVDTFCSAPRQLGRMHAPTRRMRFSACCLTKR